MQEFDIISKRDGYVKVIMPYFNAFNNLSTPYNKPSYDQSMLNDYMFTYRWMMKNYIKKIYIHKKDIEENKDIEIIHQNIHKMLSEIDHLTERDVHDFLVVRPMKVLLNPLSRHPSLLRIDIMFCGRIVPTKINFIETKLDPEKYTPKLIL